MLPTDKCFIGIGQRKEADFVVRLLQSPKHVVFKVQPLPTPHIAGTYFPFFTVKRMRERSSRPERFFSVQL